MPLLDNAARVTFGERPVRIIYREGTEVWPKLGVVVTAAPTAWDKILLTITPPSIGADSYIIKRGPTEIHSGPELTFTDTLLTPLTSYTYTVQAVKAGITLPSIAKATVITPARADMGLTATPAAYNAVNLAWTDPDGQSIDSYVLKTSGTPIYTGPAKAFTHTGRSPSTTYLYSLHGFRGGMEIPPSDNASAVTPARPTVQKQVILTCNSATSYSGNANDNRYLPDYSNRQDNRGWIFAGQYIGPGTLNFFGHQKAFWTFAIPADVRNCISIQSMYVSVFMKDVPKYNASTRFSLAVHHGNFAATGYPYTPVPGHTNVFVNLQAIDGNYLGMQEWVEVSNYVCPGRTTVKEEFRVNGAHGFMLKGMTNGIQDYGFTVGKAPGAANERPRIQINYTVWAA